MIIVSQGSKHIIFIYVQKSTTIRIYIKVTAHINTQNNDNRDNNDTRKTMRITQYKQAIIILLYNKSVYEH